MHVHCLMLMNFAAALSKFTQFRQLSQTERVSAARCMLKAAQTFRWHVSPISHGPLGCTRTIFHRGLFDSSHISMLQTHQASSYAPKP